jgi:hypothetical protein
MRRIGTSLVSALLLGSALTGCGSNMADACDAFEKAKDAEKAEVELFSMEIDDHSRAMKKAKETEERALALFDEAARDDDGWADAQEAAHQYFDIYPLIMSAEEETEKRSAESTISAACARA